MQAHIAKRQLSQRAATVQSRRSTASRTKRDKLIIEHLPLVKYVVGKIMICLPSHVDREDLIESGILGLIEAAGKFNVKKQVKFKTYAFHRIRGSILDYLRLQDWVPRSVREKENLIKKTHSFLEQQLGRIPQIEEIAEALDISCSELDKMLAEINLCSLLNLEDINYGSGDDAGAKVNVILKDRKACEPSDVLELEEEQKILERTITELQPKERMVVTLYYYEDMLLREIAEVMDLSESRVSQLHHRALVSIRAKVNRSNTAR
ncbi:MAG: FliA/WhiG family RNA polymerase sigma factor [Candidatus Scalindua sediminis]|nr:FliA/WhiG family RNA polymerase sigma factor [Candidatus Scalindua sediminis]